MKSISYTAVLAVSGVLLLASEPTAARTLNYSLGLGPGSAVDVAAQDYARQVEAASQGDLTIQVFPLDLVSLADMGPGIRDGLTDIGYLASPYYEMEFAHSNFLSGLSIMQSVMETSGRENLAYAGAMSEYIITQCPECLAEFAAQNHVYMGHTATPPNNLLCTSDIATPEDLKGRRLRAAGAAHGRFAEHLGAIGLQMPASEAYEALSQGTVDCAILAIPELTNFGLMEVVTSITTDLPGSVFAGIIAGNINRDIWQGLTDKQRATLLRAGADLAGGITWNYNAGHARDLAAAEREGKTINSPSPELKDAHADFVETELQTLSTLFSTEYGVTDAARMQEEFREVLDRWTDLVATVDNGGALSELYWTEIFSKLDPASYGME